MSEYQRKQVSEGEFAELVREYYVSKEEHRQLMDSIARDGDEKKLELPIRSGEHPLSLDLMNDSLPDIGTSTDKAGAPASSGAEADT